MTGLEFPVASAQLSEWLPHRGPAVWIDQVNWVRKDEGECRVFLRQGANYADHRGLIRESSFVEWIAQSYGFVGACQVLTGLTKMEKKPGRTFLVQVRDFELSDDPAIRLIFEGDWIDVRVKKTHQLGPVSLIEGDVVSSKEVLLARAKLKVFAD